MREKPDFPFYNGQPVAIGGGGWALVLAATAIAFAVLVTGLGWLPAPPLNFLPTVIFVVLPLAALALVAGRHWRAVFRPYGLLAVGQSVLFAVLTIAVSFGVALLVSRVAAVAGNAAAAEVAAMDATGLLLFLGRTFIQLIGEEVITILPLLAALWFCVQRLNLSRRAGLVVAVLVSTLLFGALHLPTYDWNLVQCFVIIGSARLMLTLAYIVSRNLWVSAGAHIINDWSIFLITYAGNHLPIGS